MIPNFDQQIIQNYSPITSKGGKRRSKKNKTKKNRKTRKNRNIRKKY